MDSSSTYASSSSSEPELPDPFMPSSREKLMVAVRVRPLREGEGERCLHCVDDKTILLEDIEGDKGDVLRQKRGSERKYVFDAAFGEDSTQEQVYAATTRNLVQDVLRGYNATVFAYGATGAGKTHTMVGDELETGIMVRALNDLFHSIDKLGNNYQVSLSYLEIYNENIRDLLNPSSGALELREDSRGHNIVVAGLREVMAYSTQEVMNLLQMGNQERTVEPTSANQTSSRSHALLSVTVRKSTHTREQYKTRLRQGKLYMLDLAGSERASQTKNRGKRLLEGAHINRSLLALGNVINSLSGGGSGNRYVNYRDSKLTRLLREALSGNCRTVMVAHVSPACTHRDESRNTLAYAARANGISHHKLERNVLDVSFHVSQYRNIIQELRQEINRLRSKLAEDRPPSRQTRVSSGGPVAKQLRELIVSTFRDQMKLRRRLMDIDGHLLSLGVEAERQHQIITQWESRSNKLYSRKGRPSTNQSQINGNAQDPWKEDNMHQAWSELSYIEKEQERYMGLRSDTLKELDQCRQRAVTLENDLPSRLDSDTERELLSLLCRVHELEADKMALQGERLVESHELRRRGELLQRLSRQQKITDDIITRQRQLMEEGKVQLPPDLQELYNLYQQEIHASTFNPEFSNSYESLPPINNDSIYGSRLGTVVDTEVQTPTSHSGGDWDSLPPLPTRELPVAPKTSDITSLPPLRP